ncbi:hypothetical protein QKU58_gp055 [Pyramimonas orientalis virus]|uniref:Uncharacterized protein n=1 Tax=Pyramimonas orientalis virus 01B TaxID=3134525 RepID=A0A7M3UNL1_9VIRU|nr:hypothetical protein QKU58_gp055 [Pyramimonas orientalis virus]QOI90276.1 hypothetical protein HWQ62_00139 [Pyramimonas orientalis virus]
MKQLNIFELQNSINKKKQHRTNIYENVLEKCHTKIKTAANKEKYELFYDVPQYVVGLPLFNINECIDFIIKQLSNNGFEVKYHFPKMLHISWFPPKEIANKNEPSTNNATPELLMHYIPYKNDKGKFTLNVD